MFTSKDIYEHSGVREYWIIDPSDKKAEGFYLEGNEYVPLAKKKGELRLKSLTLVIKID
jgi:Uma2 family endonuclease